MLDVIRDLKIIPMTYFIKFEFFLKFSITGVQFFLIMSLKDVLIGLGAVT